MLLECANFHYQHPKGDIFGYISEKGLQVLLLPDGRSRAPYRLHSAPNIVLGRMLANALGRYFAGIATDFHDIPLDLEGATPFRKAVWLAARTVHWGETISYGELGLRMGRFPGVARAVGQALGANPIPILIPCHRILACNGQLGGFSAGLDWKRALLEVEQSL